MRLPVLTACVSLALLCSGCHPPRTSECTPGGPEAGEAADGRSALTGLLGEYDVPSISWAISCRGEIVDRGAFGVADPRTGREATPEVPYRLASLSKWVVAAATMRLAARGELDLDAPIVALIPLEPGDYSDPRWAAITPRMLLEHSAGFDRHASFDPMFADAKIVSMTPESGPGPAHEQRILRVMLGLPLDFEPGSDFAYSNFGYAVLGRVLEEVRGQPLDEILRQVVLAQTSGATLLPARSRPSDRPPLEARYVDLPGAPNVPSVFDGSLVPEPDGGFYIEAMLAHGGLIGTPSAYARFLALVDGQPGVRDIVSPTALYARPTHDVFDGEPSYYARGANVTPREDGAHYWHTGSKPGLSTWAELDAHGTAAVVVVNARPDSGGYWNALREALGVRVDALRESRAAAGCAPVAWGPAPEPESAD